MDQGERPRNAKLLIAKRVVDIWSTALFLFYREKAGKIIVDTVAGLNACYGILPVAGCYVQQIASDAGHRDKQAQRSGLQGGSGLVVRAAAQSSRRISSPPFLRRKDSANPKQHQSVNHPL